MLPSAVTPVLPPELLESIIDEVGRSDDTQTLRAFALVCSTLLHRCQSHLFKAIDLDKRVPRERYYRHFHHLLASKPRIGTYVRHLRLGDDAEDDYGRRNGVGGISWIANAKTLPQTLGLLPRLEQFSLTFNSEMMDWNDLSPATRIALEHALSLPTLQGVSLEFISSFPPTILLSFARLKYLGLSCVEVDVVTTSPGRLNFDYPPRLEFIHLRGTPPSTISVISRSLIASPGRASIQKLSITPTFEAGFCEAINELINSPPGTNLSSFEWLPSIHFSSSIGPIDLTRLANLHFLKFVISFRRSPNQRSPFSQTLRLLNQLASEPNQVEEITLECYFLRIPRLSHHLAHQEERRLSGRDSNSTAGEWGALDALLSRPAFVRLKALKIVLSLDSIVEGDLRQAQSVFRDALLWPKLSKKGVPVLVHPQQRTDERFLSRTFGH